MRSKMFLFILSIYSSIYPLPPLSSFDSLLNLGKVQSRFIIFCVTGGGVVLFNFSISRAILYIFKLKMWREIKIKMIYSTKLVRKEALLIYISLWYILLTSIVIFLLPIYVSIQLILFQMVYNM